MSTNDTWRLIEHDKKGLPSLILRSSIRSDGYAVYLSDLEHIWVEELTKDAIIERAQELGCSIDPSQDSEQYRIFVNKLQGAFGQASGTSLELKSVRSGSNITLSLSIPLPKPLRTLEWEIHLQRRDHGQVGVQLTQPLIRRAYTLQQQLRQLIEELHHKDHVISRLTDRLEASGTPLSEVYPNVAAIRGQSKHISREKLASQIPGLRPFDEQSWSSRAVGDQIDIQRSLPEVLPKLVLGETSEPQTTSWWRELNVQIVGTSNVNHDTAQAEDNTLNDLPVVPADDESTDDEFQQSSRTTPSTAKHVSTTATKKNSSPQPIRKLGAVGGGRATSETDSIPQVPQLDVQTKPRLGAIGGKKAAIEVADSDQDTTMTSPKPPSLPTRKLGAIGGKKTVSEPAVDQEATSSSPMPTQTRRLGAFGGKKATGMVKQENHSSGQSEREETTSIDNETHNTPAVKVEGPEVPSGDTADYRRDQLKRQQEQAKPAVKKKRRF